MFCFVLRRKGNFYFNESTSKYVITDIGWLVEAIDIVVGQSSGKSGLIRDDTDLPVVSVSALKSAFKKQWKTMDDQDVSFSFA